MKKLILILPAILVLAVLLTGCTGQPAQQPAMTPAGTPVITTAPATPARSITGTNWKLGWYDDTKGVWSKVIEGSTITAVFTSDNKLRGSGGCNQYTTDYRLLESPGIWIKRPAVQQKTCQTPTGVNNQESFYYTDLEWAVKYKIENSQLQMFDKTGKKILQFDPMT